METMDTHSAARGKGEHPWVQPIVIAKSGSHEDTVALAAEVSLAVRLKASSSEEERFRLWLSGPFTKSVRRATPDQMEKVKAWADEAGISHAEAEAGHSAALALTPMRYEDMPKVLSRLQVSGTDLARAPHGEGLLAAPPRVAVLESLTTGKASAQAAHALWKWGLDLDLALPPEGTRVSIRLVTAEELADLAAATPHLAVYDNGLTEVDPHTLTAVALA